MSSKSANYCCSYISGGEALLLLCDAELGQPMQTLTDASYNAGEDAIKKGVWSTWGQGSTGPKGWKDAGCVHPTLAGVSMVCYPLSEIRSDAVLTYLNSRTSRMLLGRPVSKVLDSTTVSDSNQAKPFRGWLTTQFFLDNG